MSDGGIGEGIVFWATIRIMGNLEKEELKKVTNGIRKLLSDGGIEGDIMQAVRITAAEEPVLSISMKESITRARKKKAKKK